ncbi:MAG: hypothetical protein ABSC20_02550 [Candidatus Bathyarchaeia archaeon]|jgi:hypothetical protein
MENKNKEDTEDARANNEDEWQRLSYQEIGEDRRHFDSMLWEIPTAIFLVDSFLLGLVSSLSGKGFYLLILQEVLLGFASAFTILLTVTLRKVAKRSIDRMELLKQMEGQTKEQTKEQREVQLPPIKHKRFPEEKGYLTWKVGVLVCGLLILFAFVLIGLMIALFFLPSHIFNRYSFYSAKCIKLLGLLPSTFKG